MYALRCIHLADLHVGYLSNTQEGRRK